MADDDSEYISVVQAVELISITLNGNPKQFCEGVEAARQVVHPSQHPLLLNFIKSKITGEAKDRLLARSERHTWEQIKLILEENYAVRRTLEYHANVLFSTKQGMSETVAQWGSRIDNMGLDLMREARTRIERINRRAVEGGTISVSEFMKGSFVAGLKDNRIKYVVKAKGEDHSLAQLVETALQEESEVKSKKFKGNQGSLNWPNAGSYRSLRKDFRPQIKREVNAITSPMCFRCQRVGHAAKDCRARAPTCGSCQKVGHEARNCRAGSSQGNGK
jgi:DNA-directed RNA polymerase subunit L